MNEKTKMSSNNQRQPQATDNNDLALNMFCEHSKFPKPESAINAFVHHLKSL